MSDKKSARGRPPVLGRQIRKTIRFREGRSGAEDALIARLDALPPRNASRFIRRVLTTGEIDAVIEREFERESERVRTSLDAMAGLWDDEESNDETT